jgi:hypothetical protein
MKVMDINHKEQIQREGKIEDNWQPCGNKSRRRGDDQRSCKPWQQLKEQGRLKIIDNLGNLGNKSKRNQRLNIIHNPGNIYVKQEVRLNTLETNQEAERLKIIDNHGNKLNLRGDGRY